MTKLCFHQQQGGRAGGTTLGVRRLHARAVSVHSLVEVSCRGISGGVATWLLLRSRHEGDYRRVCNTMLQPSAVASAAWDGGGQKPPTSICPSFLPHAVRVSCSARIAVREWMPSPGCHSMASTRLAHAHQYLITYTLQHTLLRECVSNVSNVLYSACEWDPRNLEPAHY